MIPAANLDYMWSNLNARIGIPYKWGGTLDPNDPTAGTDCSGAVGFVIEALLYGPAMNWDRPFWTGTFAGMVPGEVAAPWGLVCIAHPSDAPPDAAAIVAISQGPSADTSHMIVRVLDRCDDPEGIDIEDNGQGLQKYDRAANITDPQFNQWFYLPGPLEMPAPPPVSNLVTVLANAIGLDVQRSQEILPAVRDGLTQSQCTTANRIAMWLAQIGHESAGFDATEEYQSGDESQERWLYKGRTWIQITWRSHYAEFSQWCFDRQLVSSPTYFVENPRQLADLKWAALGPAWYWTVARPDINTLSDAGDLETVTQRINGGYNGLDDRRNRYSRAHDMGDQLLVLVGTAPLPPPVPPPPPQPPSELTLEQMVRELYAMLKFVYDEMSKRGPSRSFLAPDQNPIDTMLGFDYNIDGNAWNDLNVWGYLFDVPYAVERVESVAQNGVDRNSWAAGNEFVAQFGQAFCKGLVEFKTNLRAALATPQAATAAKAPAKRPPAKKATAKKAPAKKAPAKKAARKAAPS